MVLSHRSRALLKFLICLLWFEVETQKLLLLDDVKKYLSDKFSYLMVDEYQDTNELQYNIFMPILDNLKKGNLFVVGDEKQAIFGALAQAGALVEAHIA